MLVDANVLLFAQDSSSPHHPACRDWLTDALNGPVRTGLPWPSLLAFLRLRTNPRIYSRPLDSREAWQQVTEWLAAPAAWIPSPTDRHADVLGALLESHRSSANAVPDAHLAALAIEHGVGICSADTDFARFENLRWVNPLVGPRSGS